MNLKEYIQVCRDAHDALESDMELLEELATELDEVISNVESADDFFEIQEALEQLDNLTTDASDLIIPESKPLTDGYNPEGWKDELAQNVSYKDGGTIE